MKVSQLMNLLSSYQADDEVRMFNGGSFDTSISDVRGNAYEGVLVLHGGYRHERVRDFCLAMKCGVEVAKYFLDKYNYNLALAIQDFQRGQTVSRL